MVTRSLHLQRALGSDRNLNQVEGAGTARRDEVSIHTHLGVLGLGNDGKQACFHNRRETRRDLGGLVHAVDAKCLGEWLVAVRLNGQQTTARLRLVQQLSIFRNAERLPSKSYRGMLFSKLRRNRERQEARIRLLRGPKSKGGDRQDAGGHGQPKGNGSALGDG